LKKKKTAASKKGVVGRTGKNAPIIPITVKRKPRKRKIYFFAFRIITDQFYN
jgi:hypothetical protein